MSARCGRIFRIGVRGMASTSFHGCKGILRKCSFDTLLGRVGRAPIPSSIICMPSIRRLRTLSMTGTLRGGKFNKVPVRVKCYGKRGGGLGTMRCRHDSRVGMTMASLILLVKDRRSVASSFACSASGVRTFLMPTKANVRMCTAALRCTPYGMRSNNFRYMIMLPTKAGASLAFRATGANRSDLLATGGG